MQFAAGTLFFAGLGYLLDRWLNIVPALTVAGLLLGGTLSFLSIYRRVIGDSSWDRGRNKRPTTAADDSGEKDSGAQ
jgi:F0F1-type ATP synthase assembly protein I